MKKLSKQLAQKIVDKMMQVIPYNVIIADEKGLIIGSSDRERIYKMHSGAQEALTYGKMVKVYDDSDALNVKQGVNSPIFSEGKIVGVIGIAGDPDVVKAFSQLVSVTAELLINQEYTINRKKIKEQKIEKFLYELAYKTDEYSEIFIERGLSIGIDLKTLYVAVVFNSSKTSSKKIKGKLNQFLEKNEYILSLNVSNTIIFMDSNTNIVRRIERYLESEKLSDVNVGIGSRETLIANSLNQAIAAINIGNRLTPDKNIFLYRDLNFVSQLSKFKEDKRLKNIVEKLKEEGRQADLLETLATYVYSNGEVNKTSEKLHIHRNTLNYRFEKIQEITGKNPRNMIELFELFTAYVVSML